MLCASSNRITFRPDVSILALGVVLIIMILGHFVGTSLRRLVAFRPKDETTTVFGLRSHRRQAHWPLFISLAGIALNLTFLFTSRSMLESVTKAHRDQAQAQAKETRLKLDSAPLEQKQALQDQWADDTATLKTREDAYQYASSVSSMNLAIFWLNLSLATVALGSTVPASNSERSADKADAWRPAVQTQRQRLQRGRGALRRSRPARIDNLRSSVE